jgi:hypothetical protein
MMMLVKFLAPQGCCEVGPGAQGSANTIQGIDTASIASTLSPVPLLRKVRFFVFFLMLILAHTLAREQFRQIYTKGLNESSQAVQANKGSNENSYRHSPTTSMSY